MSKTNNKKRVLSIVSTCLSLVAYSLIIYQSSFLVGFGVFLIEWSRNIQKGLK